MTPFCLISTVSTMTLEQPRPWQSAERQMEDKMDYHQETSRNRRNIPKSRSSDRGSFQFKHKSQH